MSFKNFFRNDYYTITVIRNHGIPINLVINRKKMIISSMIFFSIFLLFSYLAALYFFQSIKLNQQDREITTAIEKVKKLSNYIARKDYENYYDGTDASANINKYRAGVNNQPEFLIEGITSTSSKRISLDDLTEGASIGIVKFNPYTRGDYLYLDIRLKNNSKPYQMVGGYVFVTFNNEDQNTYRSLTGGELGDNGFPESYKSGFQYSLKKKKRKFSKRMKLTNVSEYYTSATIFIYTYRGQLLSKENFDISKSIFLY